MVNGGGLRLFYFTDDFGWCDCKWRKSISAEGATSETSPLLTNSGKRFLDLKWGKHVG